MKIRLSIILIALIISLLHISKHGMAQERTVGGIPIVDYEGLRPSLEKQNDTTYIINFWATWCAPCIKELPYFQKIHDKYINEKIRVILVSLDFEKQIETRLVPFIKKNKVTPTVIVLSDPNSNAWIDKIDPTWSGALPATLFYNRQNRIFLEKSFTYNEIEEVLRLMNAIDSTGN